MDLHGSHGEGLCKWKPDWQIVRVWEEHRIWCTLESSVNIGSEVLRISAQIQNNLSRQGTYIHRANEVFITHEYVGHSNAKEDGEDPGSYEALDRLLGRQLDELGSAKRNTTDIRKYIVADDQGHRQKEPDHALEYVIHYEMSLDHDEI